MKLRMEVLEKARAKPSARAREEHFRVLLAPATLEAPEFVPVGPTPGRRQVVARLVIEQLTRQAAEQFDDGEYVLTLERVAKA